MAGRERRTQKILATIQQELERDLELEETDFTECFYYEKKENKIIKVILARPSNKPMQTVDILGLAC